MTCIQEDHDVFKIEQGVIQQFCVTVSKRRIHQVSEEERLTSGGTGQC